MDKHDRPYRCAHDQCAKLQGFTYSGGLLRHEREVHGKHGGPKAQLMCPYDDCKRHTGKGFTRKENLNEHIRRVHETKTQASQQTEAQTAQTAQNVALQAELQEAIAGAEQLADLQNRLPYPEQPPVQYEPEVPEMIKRPRLDQDGSPSLDVEDLKQEVARLRAENAEKDDRLRRMEVAEAQRESRLKQLEDALGNMQQPQPDGHMQLDQKGQPGAF